MEKNDAGFSPCTILQSQIDSNGNLFLRPRLLIPPAVCDSCAFSNPGEKLL